MTSEENTTSAFNGFKYGEWQRIGDRVRRRAVHLSRIPDVVWQWEYQIERNYEGDILTATCRIAPEIIGSVNLTQLNEMLRDAFCGTLSQAIGERDGNWIDRK